MSELVSRMVPFGTTIFTEITALANMHDAINLGQGAPDTDGPALVREAAIRAIREGRNQYAPGIGIRPLREAIARHQERWHGVSLDPETEIQATAGATEALAATFLALCGEGDEVIVLEPFYDVYPAVIALAGATLVPVRLDAPGFRVDAERLAAAVTPRTRAILVNTPHNPTGHVLERDELEAISRVAIEHDLIVVTDEVYEHLAFDGREHISIASLPGMRERTITISSAGKTFSTTGWKIGWMCGPERLVGPAGVVKQFLTFANGHPFQWAIAEGLGMPDGDFLDIRDRLQAQRDLLVPGLEAAGMRVMGGEGTYFVVADVADVDSSAAGDSRAFCSELPRVAGVAAIPMKPFYADPAGAETLVRFAFCKRPEVVAEAADRIARAFAG